jgi:hypothetical protein
MRDIPAWRLCGDGCCFGRWGGIRGWGGGERGGGAYIVFPNSAYGSWISALAKDYMIMTPEDLEDFYCEMLTE